MGTKNIGTRDPLSRAISKAYRATAVGKLEALLETERRWKRRQTIADNKLSQAREAVVEYATLLAKQHTDMLATLQKIEQGSLFSPDEVKNVIEAINSGK